MAKYYVIRYMISVKSEPKDTTEAIQEIKKSLDNYVDPRDFVQWMEIDEPLEFMVGTGGKGR